MVIKKRDEELKEKKSINVDDILSGLMAIPSISEEGQLTDMDKNFKKLTEIFKVRIRER